MENSTQPTYSTKEATQEISDLYPTENGWLSCVPEEYRNVDLSCCRDINPEIVKLAIQCITKEPMISLFLCGHWGSGKTTLSFALIRFLMQTKAKQQYFWPNWASGNDLDKSLLKPIRDGGTDEWEIEKRSESDLLFIDDIDKVTPTERLKMQLFSILKNRMEKKKLTIITSNCLPQEMEKIIDGAIVSRLADKSKWCVIKFPNKDLRKIRPIVF